MLRVYSAAALALLAPCLLVAQGAPHPVAVPGTVEVSVQGEFHAEPDTALVQMEITGQGAALQAAYAQAQAQAEQVRSLLRRQGFRPAQAHWSGYQVQPNVDYKTQRVKDYTVTTSLRLEMSDFAKIGPLVDAAGSAGLNALRGVSFELKDMDAAKAAAIADGYQRAQAEAEALAHAAGRQLSGLSRATVDVSTLAPRPVLYAMASSRMAGAPAPTAEFTPQQITVTARISAVFRLNP